MPNSEVNLGVYNFAANVKKAQIWQRSDSTMFGNEDFGKILGCHRERDIVLHTHMHLTEYKLFIAVKATEVDELLL